MKICPKCQQTYTDASLNFCLNDGTSLTEMSSQQDSLPETVLINQPRQTDPNPPAFGTEPQFGSQQNVPPPNWSTPQPQPYSMQPKTKSKSWVWVVGILGVLVLLCGGGLVGFFAWVANQENANNTNIYSNENSSTNNTRVNTNTNANSTTPKSSLREVDFSTWTPEDSESVTTTYSNGAFTMKTKKEGYFYVMIARDYKTQDGTAKVTVKNTDSKPTDVGFGILVHSSTTPLIQDYGFLIDSEKKRYRIVRHSLKTENVEKDWQGFSGINGGSTENVLEVRDKGSKMEFYINGKYVTSQTDSNDNKDGVIGIYSSDAIPIAFSKLGVEK